MVTTITGVWEFILQCGAGLGILLILRWFWFRINAWAEIAATITPFIVYAILKLILVNRFPELGMDISENPISFIITTSVTILVWLLVALNSKPDTDEHIAAFTDKVFPEGHRTHLKRMGPLFLAWLGGLCIVYSFLFSIGKLILLEYRESLYFLISLIIGALLFYFSAKKARLF
jgi:hypothetical protein